MMNKRGVTLLELILVLVIIAIGASLAVPKLRKSVENREAKAALGTLQSISHAARMYEVTKGGFPEDFDITDLETTDPETTDPATGTRYLDPVEYAPGYTYGITVKEGEPVTVVAGNSNRRRIILTQCGDANKSKDGAVGDSAGFLTSPAAC